MTCCAGAIPCAFVRSVGGSYPGGVRETNAHTEKTHGYQDRPTPTRGAHRRPGRRCAHPARRGIERALPLRRARQRSVEGESLRAAGHRVPRLPALATRRSDRGPAHRDGVASKLPIRATGRRPRIRHQAMRVRGARCTRGRRAGRHLDDHRTRIAVFEQQREDAHRAHGLRTHAADGVPSFRPHGVPESRRRTPIAR